MNKNNNKRIPSWNSFLTIKKGCNTISQRLMTTSHPHSIYNIFKEIATFFIYFVLKYHVEGYYD